MEAKPKLWTLDPTNVRAPSVECWAAMTAEEREAVYLMLPENPYPLSEMMSEGDTHRRVAVSAADALDNWFRERKKRAYIGRGMTVYYPNQPPFAPDVFVVLDAEPGDRTSWMVSREGLGLDVVIEVHHHGSRIKDLRRNVDQLARLGVTEYFVFEIGRYRLSGWRLPEGQPQYGRLVPQHGHLRSDVLGLEIGIEGGRIRFYAAGATLPDQQDLITRLTSAVDTMTLRAESEAQRAKEEAQRAKEEAQRAKEEAQRADELARRLATLEAELAKLRGETDASEPN